MGSYAQRFDWRPLEGVVLAVPPFNFYSIGGNLATAPAMAGNVVLWKPARSVLLANFRIMQVLQEAGLPEGVINFVPFSHRDSDVVLRHPALASVHFTAATRRSCTSGSTSAVELAVLLSALSGMPLDQGGRLQAVSSVNGKVESFYAVCQALGLTGTQGVIIPCQNLKHLTFHEDVAQAKTCLHPWSLAGGTDRPVLGQYVPAQDTPPRPR